MEASRIKGADGCLAVDQHLRLELFHLLRLELGQRAPRGGQSRRECRQVCVQGLALLDGIRQLGQVAQGGASVRVLRRVHASQLLQHHLDSHRQRDRRPWAGARAPPQPPSGGGSPIGPSLS
eukprot:scaffold36849_cov79-Phaeocystis_antarctica.AAC.2